MVTKEITVAQAIKAVQEVAASNKLGGAQIDKAKLLLGLGKKPLLSNPLVCLKCHNPTSVVGRHMCCEECETTLSRSDKKFLANATPTYEDDIMEAC